MQSSAAAYLIKHPSKPVVVHTVVKCGDVVDTALDHLFPLVMDASTAEASSPLEIFRPISDVLNKYSHLYQSCLPMDVLNSSLEALHGAYPSTVYETDVPDMIRELRRTFVRGCVALKLHCRADGEKPLTMLHEIDSMLSPECSSIVLEDIHLTGLEYYLQYLLLGGNSKDASSDALYLIEQALRRCTEIEPDFALRLCSAVAYFVETERTEFSLRYESAINRYQMHCSIHKGLEHIKESILKLKHPRQKLVSLISQLMTRVSTLKEHHKFELFLEVSNQMEDKRDPHSLLCLIHVIKPLYQQFQELECVINCTGEDMCAQVLSSPEFYAVMTLNVLKWYSSQQHKLTELLQIIMSDPLFASDDKAEEVLNLFTSWLLNGLERAVLEWKWENVQLIVLTSQRIVKALQSDVKSAYENHFGQEGFQCPDLLSNLLTIIQVIRVIPDLRAVLNILKQFPAELWLQQLLAHNFMNIITCYYGVEVDTDLYHELVKIDTKLLQILYNVFVNDQYNKPEGENPVGMVSLSQLSTIIESLLFVDPCNDVYTTLCRTSLSLWERELAKINFKQYLDSWTEMSEANKQRTMFLMNRVRVEANISHKDFMSLLFTMRSKCLVSDCPDGTFLVPLFEDLYYKRVSLQEARSIITGNEFSEWSVQFEALKAIQKQRGDPQSVEDILSLIESQIEKGEFVITRLDEFKEEAHQVIAQVCSNSVIQRAVSG